MKNFISTLLVAGLVPLGATAAFAQSGPVDSKGQAGSVQQLGSGVTQGTNAQDAADSRARMDAMSGKSEMTTGSTGSAPASNAPAGSAGGEMGGSPQSKSN